MAAVPGTSGTSGGKDVKLTTKSPRGKPDIDTRVLKCTACKRYPREEVYQCFDGHLICNECILKIKICCVCGHDYGQTKIRNTIVEGMLDGCTFNCGYRTQGCLKTHIPRKELNAHEFCCHYGSRINERKVVFKKSWKTCL